MKHPVQEHDIVPGWKIAGVGLGVIVATVAGTLIAYGIGRCSTRDLSAGSQSRTPLTMTEINSMETVPFDREAPGLEMHQRAEAFLSTYGWVDREREIAHVPIEVATELYLARRAANQINAAREP